MKPQLHWSAQQIVEIGKLLAATGDYCAKHEFHGRHCLDCSVEALARTRKLDLTPVRQIMQDGPLNVWGRS